MLDMASVVASFMATTIFGEKLETDSREPLFVFSVGPFGEFGVIGIVSQLWLQMFALSLLHVAIVVLAAFLAYRFVLNKKQSTSALLVGYGLICPLLVYVPFCMIQAFDLRNPVLKLTAVSSPALHVLRCFETIYDTLPTFATKSFRSFMWYFGATVEYNVDPRTKEVISTSREEIKRKCKTLIVVFFQCVALYTILAPFSYNLFPRRSITKVSDIVFWGNLCNNYFVGALTKSTIEYGMTMLGLLVSLLSGFSTADVNVRPLTATSSPSDFWGRRWNTLVSSGLKRGIYKPFRKQGFSQPAAAFATFAASGVLHEYFLAATAFVGRSSLQTDESFEVHLIGGHLLFFLWNAIVLILEGLLQGTTIIQMMEKRLPKPVRTALVFMTVLPIVHCFTDQFVSLGLYSGFSLGYPRIIPIN